MPKVGGTLVRNSGPQKGTLVKQPKGVGSNPPAQFYLPGSTKRSQKRKDPSLPQVSIESREHPFLNMLQDPQHAQSALPPVVLPARAVASRVYQEVCLSTDAAGNAGIRVSPRPNNMFGTVATWSANSPATFNSFNAATYTSFSNNFGSFIPTCVEVVAKYAGSMQSTSGRFYGIAGAPGNVTTNDVGTFPQEHFGCETIASEGTSCTWYSTSPIWNNPQSVGLATDPTEWGDTAILVALIGGPVSVTNLVTVGIYFHFVAFPKIGIVGLEPTPSQPDSHAATIAGLMSAATEGFASSAMSEIQRAKYRKRRLKIKDVLRIGGQVVGTIAPLVAPGLDAAALLSTLLV